MSSFDEISRPVITTCRPNAVKVSSRVLTRVAGSPFSSLDMVACRKPMLAPSVFWVRHCLRRSPGERPRRLVLLSEQSVSWFGNLYEDLFANTYIVVLYANAIKIAIYAIAYQLNHW